MTNNQTYYRLYLGVPCEDARAEALHRFALLFPKGFTAYDAAGHWDTSNEPCLILELLSAGEPGITLANFAAWYKRAWAQECVLLTQHPCRGEFL